MITYCYIAPFVLEQVLDSTESVSTDECVSNTSYIYYYKIITSQLSAVSRLFVRLNLDSSQPIKYYNDDLKSISFNMMIIVFTILMAILIPVVGRNILYNRRRHDPVSDELNSVQAKLRYLQEKLQQLEKRDDFVYMKSKSKGQEIRIFMDGAFDLLHFGHMNAFRLARSLGTFRI